MRLRGAVLSLPGHDSHASDVVRLSPDELVFTADNYTHVGATERTLLRASYVGERLGTLASATAVHLRHLSHTYDRGC